MTTTTQVNRICFRVSFTSTYIDCNLNRIVFTGKYSTELYLGTFYSISQKILHLFTSSRIFGKASPAILPSDLDQDLASYGGIKSRIDGSRVPTLAATTAGHRHILLRDRRRQPASFDDPAGNGQSRVVFEQQIDLSGALSTLVDGPDDQRLSSSGISASPHTVDARGVRLSLKARTWQ